MRFRPHRRHLAEAMAECVTVDGMEGLMRHLRRSSIPPKGPVKVEAYSGPDDRIGWPTTYIVTEDGYGVRGFTDGPA